MTIKTPKKRLAFKTLIFGIIYQVGTFQASYEGKRSYFYSKMNLKKKFQTTMIKQSCGHGRTKLLEL